MIHLAIIGAGRFGSRYLETIEQMHGVIVKYVCVTTPGKHKDLNKRYVVLDDYKKLFAYKDVDGVIIATPASTHAQIAFDFIEKKWPILIEKPMTTSLSDALHLYTCWKKRKGIVFVGHIHLYNPAFIAMSNLLSKIGDVERIDGVAGNWGPIRVDTTLLWDWAIHEISMVNYLLNKTPITVQAFVDNLPAYNYVTIKMKYKGKLTTVITNSWSFSEKVRKMTIVGKKGIVSFDDISDKKLIFHERSGTTLKKTTYPTYLDKKPLQNELENFITCIKKNIQPTSNIAFALNTIKVLDAAERSLLEEGKVVKISHV
ncbi:MAG: Gfo/Idh/MocA family oxidoreductase [Candidatus Levybacteria bacterium]|nr:Gfo/Idh/MocA family oxidoreductase [Candidatus Levybacteria bacterium]